MASKTLNIFGKKVSQETAYFVGALGLVGLGWLITKKSPPPQEKPLPTGGAGIPTVGTDEDGEPIPWSPVALREEMHEAMDGPFGYDLKEEAFAKGNALTDDQIVALYNSFNNTYYDDSGQTLTQWVRNEYVRTDQGNLFLATLERLQLD